MMAGVGDICIISHGFDAGLDHFVGFMEVKKKGGALNKAQKIFRDECEHLSIPYAVVRSVDEAKDTLKEWWLN